MLFGLTKFITSTVITLSILAIGLSFAGQQISGFETLDSLPQISDIQLNADLLFHPDKLIISVMDSTFNKLNSLLEQDVNIQ